MFVLRTRVNYLFRPIRSLFIPKMSMSIGINRFMEEEKDTIKCLTTKEIKKLARPEFRENPDKFYPTETLRRLGFERNECPKCNNFYWRASEERDTCGDSNCIGKYTFIDNGFLKEG